MEWDEYLMIAASIIAIIVVVVIIATALGAVESPRLS